MGSDLVDAVALREGRKHEVVQTCRAVRNTVQIAKTRTA